MLTRIPGTGAELMVLILQRLQGYNAFKHIRLPPSDYGFLSAVQQVSSLSFYPWKKFPNFSNLFLLMFLTNLLRLIKKIFFFIINFIKFASKNANQFVSIIIIRCP